MSTTNQMNLFTSSILNYPDLAKDFLFQTVFGFKAGTAIYQLVASMESPYGDDNGIGDILMLRARSISLPQKRVETINTQYMGGKRNYPGRVWVDGTVQIKFDEFQDLALQKIFYEWGNMIYNHSFPNMNKANSNIEAGGAASDFIEQYTATVDIYLYDSALKGKLAYAWRLYDVFPTENGTVELNAEGTGKIAPTMTFNYNTWQMLDQSKGEF